MAALGAAALFGGAGPAQAALYTGNWDPAYGGVFPNLGWQASALFDIPNACLAVDTAGITPLGGACTGFTVLSASVSLYNVGAPATILGTYALGTGVTVTGISISGGELTGVDTNFFNSFVPSLAIAGSGNYAFSLLLYGGDQAQLIYANPIGTSPGCAQFPVPGALCGVSANAATGVFAAAPIPEPETYALMLAGLGALGFMARRRRR